MIDPFILLIVAVLAIPFLAVVAIIMEAGARDRIRRLELCTVWLEARIAELQGEAPPRHRSAPCSAGASNHSDAKGGALAAPSRA